MKKEVRVRGINENIWKRFRLKCEQEFGKQWGHIPNEDSPKRSGPAYVLERLIELFLEGKVCVFEYQKDKKTLIINKSVDTLANLQRETGPFGEEHVKGVVRDWSLMFGMKPSKRTLEDYSELIIAGYCVQHPGPGGLRYSLDYDRLLHINANTHEFDHMFG